jgi:hypothetical protein
MSMVRFAATVLAVMGLAPVPVDSVTDMTEPLALAKQWGIT